MDVRSELFGKLGLERMMALEFETVDRLIATLDADPKVDEAWAAEVERRQAETENGSVSLLSGPETLAKLKAEFGFN